MMSNIKKYIYRNWANISGWTTKRKIVVIESDDWGAIRMPSLQIRDKLRQQGICFSFYGYDDVDTLASKEDLEALFGVLSRHKDKNGNHPIITANTIMTNPDFRKIAQSGFQDYYYELFTETLKRYYPNDNVFSVWQEGITARLFQPQFHGREHVNVQMWLEYLRAGNECVRKAFNCEVYSPLIREDVRKKFLHTYNIAKEEEKSFVRNSISEGLRLFEQIFGFKSLSTIAPSFTWDEYVEQAFDENGVKYIQGSLVQCTSKLDGRKIIRHHTGQVNKLSQIYMVRNASFEPSQCSGQDVVSECLKDIQNAFFWHKPAIISAHRLNFIGELNKRNRLDNLVALDILLRKILLRYSDVEFMSSEQLGEIIKKTNK